MERLVLDSSVWIAIERRKLDFSDVIGTGMTLILPAMVAAELKHVMKIKARTPMQMQRSLNYLSKVEALTEFAPIDQRVADRYAEIKHFSMASGKPRGTADLLLAATAIEYKAKLYSMDKKADFGSLPNLLLHS